MASNMRASSEYSTESPRNDNSQDPPKRKGGRKAMFSMEARKQRNREAQAAFRERRTEYIKELEETVKMYSSKLRTMEAARTSTADDCLMLRYKNSLLERILIHKGVDVQAELNTNIWRPTATPGRTAIEPHITDRHGSLKRKAKILSSRRAPPAQEAPLPTPESQHHSPIPNSPETPPASAPPSKRAKIYQPACAPYVVSPPDRREDHRNVFSPASKPHFHETCDLLADGATPAIASLTEFLDIDDNPYNIPRLEDFDFSLEYS